MRSRDARSQELTGGGIKLSVVGRVEAGRRPSGAELLDREGLAVAFAESLVVEGYGSWLERWRGRLVRALGEERCCGVFGKPVPRGVFFVAVGFADC